MRVSLSTWKRKKNRVTNTFQLKLVQIRPEKKIQKRISVFRKITRSIEQAGFRPEIDEPNAIAKNNGVATTMNINNLSDTTTS